MSSESSSTSACPVNEIPAVGTPEYEKYYYKKIEESVYRNMAHGVERFPDLPLCVAWSSMSDVDRGDALVKVNSYLEYGYAQWDIENQERFDDVTHLALSIALDPWTKRLKPKPKVTKVSSGNSLLKMAIRRSALAKEARSRS